MLAKGRISIEQIVVESDRYPYFLNYRNIENLANSAVSLANKIGFGREMAGSNLLPGTPSGSSRLDMSRLS